MDARAQVLMVFHLDKCTGCHACSIARKDIWSDRQGTECMEEQRRGQAGHRPPDAVGGSIKAHR